MTSQPPTVMHVIRPEPDGSIGGADLHVLELAAAQKDLALARPHVFAPGHGRDFAHRAFTLGVAVVLRPWQLHLTNTTIIHAHGYEADLIALLLANVRHPLGRRPPIAMTCHGIIQPDFRHRVLNSVDRICLRRADALIGVSAGAVRQLRQIAPSRPVHLVRNGIRAPQPVPDDTRWQVRRQLGAQNGEPLVGFVGRLSREKRPDLFLTVAEIIGARHKAVRFTLVGGGALIGEMKRAIRRSTVRRQVVLAGLRHDMNAVFAALDVLVVPSDVENTPRVVLEALARGVPAVVTAVGDMPMMVRHAPHTAVAAPGDPGALADAVIRLVGARSAFHRDGTATVRTIDHMARDVQRVYARLVLSNASS